MARPEGFEPPTTWFEARYSIQLSYGRVEAMVIKSLPTCSIKYNSPCSALQKPDVTSLQRPATVNNMGLTCGKS